MTDDRNATPGAAAPPPQAPPPIPAQPPYAPASQVPPTPAYAAPPTPWGWIVAALLAVVLITLVCLYFFTDLLSRAPRDSWDDSDSSSSQSGTGSQSSFGSASSAPVAAPAPLPAPAPSTGAGSGYAPTASWLQGTWGPSCPGSRAQVVTFDGGGRFTSDGGDGTWSLDGYNVTLNTNGRTMVTRWEYVTQDMARVTQLAGGQTTTVQRCS